MKRIKFPGISSAPVIRKRRAAQLLKRLLPVFAVLAVVSLLAFFIAASGSGSVVRYVFQGGTSLKSTDGKVNVLLLGIAGGTHDGANLTDTIMIASYNLTTHKLYLISLPRDMWLDSIRGKINSAYEIGKSRGSGLDFVKSQIAQVLGIPIHYAFRLDFSGFVKAVDTIGGIDVIVDNSFDDYKYPIEGKENDLCGFVEQEIDFIPEEAQKLNIDPGKRKVLVDPSGKIATDSADPVKGEEYFVCRFEHISFKSGLTHMDGKTALKFVRSRKGTNKEGSDFARSRRQTKVIEAVRSRVLSLEVLADPQKIKELVDTFGRSIDTDTSVTDALEFYKLSRKIESVKNAVIDDSSKEGLLYNPPFADYGGAYVLVPKQNNFDEIHRFVTNLLSGEEEINEASASARPGR